MRSVAEGEVDDASYKLSSGDGHIVGHRQPPTQVGGGTLGQVDWHRHAGQACKVRICTCTCIRIV